MDVMSADQITIVEVTDISSMTTYYKLQSADDDAPSTPTTNPPGIGWSPTEPTLNPDSDDILYATVQTVFTDGSFSYTQPSVSSTYAAAKDASKTATNCMEFVEGTGLIVGDMTEDTLGKNTLIDSNGVAIRDGEDELARFAADRVSLLSGEFELLAGQTDTDLIYGEVTCNAIDSKNDGIKIQNTVHNDKTDGVFKTYDAETDSKVSVYSYHDRTRPTTVTGSTVSLQSTSKASRQSDPQSETAYVSVSSAANAVVDPDNDNIKLETQATVSAKTVNLLAVDLHEYTSWIHKHPAAEYLVHGAISAPKETALDYILDSDHPLLQLSIPFGDSLAGGYDMCICEIHAYTARSTGVLSARRVILAMFNAWNNTADNADVTSSGTSHLTITQSVADNIATLKLQLGDTAYKIRGYIKIRMIGNMAESIMP